LIGVEGKGMSESKGYNGWTNYETWAVALWIDNDQWSSERAREMARGHAEEPSLNRLTGRDQTAYQLAKDLRDWVEEEMLPALGDASLQADLLGAAVSEVNWQEIAEHYLDLAE
jgi:hypothetical protein